MTIWARTDELPLGSLGSPRAALALDSLHPPATQPTVPANSAAGEFSWSPVPDAAQRYHHTDTPTKLVPVIKIRILEAGCHLLEINRVCCSINLIYDWKQYLYIRKVNSIQICQHLIYLWRILKHSPRCLSQVIERSVSPQRLSKSTHCSQL